MDNDARKRLIMPMLARWSDDACTDLSRLVVRSIDEAIVLPEATEHVEQARKLPFRR